MTELVRRDATPSLPEKMEWVRTIASASLLPRQYQNNPGNLLFAVEYADALGVNRMAAITSIHVIEGKPSASADLIANLVRKAGHKLRVSGDDQQAVAQIIRADDPDFTYEARWTMDKARAASLTGKAVWKNYPGAMLRSRAITEVARMGASDALFGIIYTPEELGATVDADGAVVHTVTQVQPQAGAGADRARDVLGVSQTGGGEGSRAETSVAEGAAGSSPAGNPSPSSPDGITSAQVRKLAVSMNEAGLTDRDSALTYVANVIGRQVGSRNDLTKDEASRVIDALEQGRPVDTVPPAEDVVDGEIVDDGPSVDSNEDPAAVWKQIQAIAASRGLASNADLEQDAEVFLGISSGEASAEELALYLNELVNRAEIAA